MNDPTVFCPITREQIDGTSCFIMCDVAEHILLPEVLYDGAPDSILQPSVEWNEELRQKCLNCKWH